jgi:hypothetical protein
VKWKLDALDGEPHLDEGNEDDDIVDVSFLDHVPAVVVALRQVRIGGVQNDDVFTIK